MKRRWIPAAVLVAFVATAISFADEPAKRPVSVLIVGGGTSHDFNKWWKEADSKILTTAAGPVSFAPSYSDVPTEAAKQFAEVDALLLPVNQLKFSAPEVRTALAARADTGKGILLLHAGTWYMYKDWPEYNTTFVGGGARGHEKIAEFDVTVVAPDHPLMKGVPPKFAATDELYQMTPDPKGNAIEVLATATSRVTGKSYPSVWIVKHPKARIAAITLGHDGRVHDLPAYQTLLVNATAWVAGK